MYCGACARDMAMARGLIRRGHDVEIVPLYTPLRLEGEAPVAPSPVFLGGVNAWLQQQSALFRRLPLWADRFLDSPALLRLASRFAVSTRPADLGPMTVSVLAGEEGQQRKELDRLLVYLGTQPPPEVISLTNSLLSGLAPRLKREYGVPLVCGLQGEEEFVAALPQRQARQAQELMQRNAAAIDLFLAPGEAYAAQMAVYLAVPPSRIAVLRPAVEHGQYQRTAPLPREPFTLGYLSVITPRKGLDILVEAWIRLVRERGLDSRLRVAGQVLDRRYLAGVRRTVARAGLQERCEFLGELDLAAKIRFLHECSVFCLPSRFAESRGIVVLEAVAAGVPVIAPASGVFPEMFGLLGAGRLFPPGDAEALAAALAAVAAAPEVAADEAAVARAGLLTHHDPAVLAAHLEGLLIATRNPV